MMVPMRPVHMAMGQFFAGGGAHLDYGQAEAQGLPGLGVVAVQQHLGALDLDHIEHLLGAVRRVAA